MGKQKDSGSSTTVVNQTTTPTPTPQESAKNQLQLSQLQAFDPYQRQLDVNAANVINKLLTGSTDLPGFFRDIYGGVNSNLAVNPPGALNASSYQTTNPADLNASQYQVSPEQTNELAAESVRGLPNYFQTQGLLDSGTAASITARTAGDVRRNVLERNLNVGLDVNRYNRESNIENLRRNADMNLNVGQYNRESDIANQQFNLNARRGGEAFNIGNLLNLLNLAVGGQASIQQPVLSTGQQLTQALAGLRSVNTQGTATQNTTQYGMNPFMKSFQTSMGQVPSTIIGRIGQGTGMYGGGSI